MAIVLNGTTGITTPDMTSDGGLTADGVSFASGAPANTLVTTSTGNVGIGTSSPSDTQSFGKAVDLRGTTGSAYYSGTTDATTRAYFATYTGGAYLGTETNHPQVFRTNNTERMRIDSSGNVGIGTSSPVNKLTLNGGASDVSFGMRTNASGGLSTDGFDITYTTSNNLYFTNRENGIIAFENNGAERARIDSSGNLLVGRTGQINQERFGVTTATDVACSSNRGSSSSYYPWIFYSNSTVVGYIFSTSTTTTYATSSDYRLKENIQPMQNALATVAQLKPCTYTWKADGSDGQGFIAHELQAVVPDCVTGEKDAVDADGNPIYQGIDTSFLVATLVAAIQELKAELDAAKADIAALKGQA